MGLFDGLFRRSRLRPYENRVVEAVASKMPLNAAARLREQASVINKVQRHTGDKEVNLYRTRFGRAEFDDDLRFPSAADEELLATVTANHPMAGPIRAEVWLAKGRLFSLVFDKPPNQILGREESENVVLNTIIWFDPMGSRPQNTKGAAAAQSVADWLASWTSAGRPTQLSPPLTPERRAPVLRRFGTEFPDDFLTMMSGTEGGHFQDGAVSGALDIRAVVIPTGNYLVLGEIVDTGVVAVREGSTDKVVYLLDLEGGTPTPVGTSFRSALAELLRRRKSSRR